MRFFDNCFENNIFWRVEKAADSAFVTCYRDLQPVHALKISCFKTKLIHLWMKIVICIACLHYQLSFFLTPINKLCWLSSELHLHIYIYILGTLEYCCLIFVCGELEPLVCPLKTVHLHSCKCLNVLFCCVCKVSIIV